MGGVAHAEFPHQDVIAAGTDNVKWPVGSAIRNWAPTDDVFTYVEWYEASTGLHTGKLKWRQCSDNDGCASISLIDTETVDAASGALVHDTESRSQFASMAISRAGPNQPIEVYLAHRDRYWDDCDGDALDYPIDMSEWDSLGISMNTYSTDLMSFSPLPTVQFHAGGDDDGITCDNHQRSFTRRDGGDTYICYEKLDEGGDEALDWYSECDVNRWNPEILTGDNFGPRPAPVFDFYLGDRMVTHDVADQSIRVISTDATGNPTQSWVADTLAGEKYAFPFLDASGTGALTVVWQHEREVLLDPGWIIQYSACDDGDCNNELMTWEAPSEVAQMDFAQHPQIAHDGDREFVLFQADSDPTVGTEFRVYATTRCRGGTWSAPEMVRVPPEDDDQQRIENGTPNLVLNRNENLAHVIFIEEEDFAPVTNARAVHAWKSYQDCP